MKDTSRNLKDKGHELANGGDTVEIMGNCSLFCYCREAFPRAGTGSDSKTEGGNKLKTLEHGLGQIPVSTSEL